MILTESPLVTHCAKVEVYDTCGVLRTIVLVKRKLVTRSEISHKS